MSKILVVDDVPDMIAIATCALRADGHEVAAAANGKEALELAATQRPDVILLDIMMPEIDGIEVCRRLKADPGLRGIPVILVTAKTTDEDVVCGLDAGADDYIAKPFRKDILAARVRSALRVKEGLDAVCRLNEQLTAEIAERKRMESELARAQKMECIGQLAAGIAHEINTPNQYLGDNLRFIQQGFAGVAKLIDALYRLLEAARKAEFAEDLVAEIDAIHCHADADYLADQIPKATRQSLEGVRHIASIVNAMKAFSHANGDHKVLTDLNQAIENTLIVCQNQWEPVADIITDLDPSLPLVPCIPGAFNEVVLNLVLNAVQAIADVVGNHPKVKGRITVQTRRTIDGVDIRIRDSGTGIPQDIHERVFDPFFTTREPGKGIGQGLAIAHAIVVQKHHGTITFETELGQGTTFTVRLPGS
jgi:signal transduction histidine kinase